MSPDAGRCYYAGIIQRQILKSKGESVGIVGLGWHTLLMRQAKVATTMNVYGGSTLRA